jgi:hypothetical protein
MRGGGSMCFVICGERQSHRGDKRDDVTAVYCNLEYQYQHQ